MLAGGDDRLGDLDVHGGDREVDDDVDVGIAEHDVDAARVRHAVLRRLLARAVLEQVADREHAHVGEAA